MDGAKVVRLIHTTLLRRGAGTEGDPVRTIDQWWTLDGELVVERDPWSSVVDAWATVPPDRQAE
jgi:hypothetical protein